MGKGSPEAVESTTTVEQSALPPYVEPYFTRLLQRTESQSLSDYTPYQGQRLAPLGQDIASAHNLTRDIASSGVAGLPQAMQQMGSNMGAAANVAGAGPYQYAQTPLMTDQGRMDSYMSPYMRNVLDVQKDQARDQHNIQRAGRDARAIQAGAFGGSRQAVAESMAEDDLLNRMSSIEATGMQNAWQQAQQGMQADRAAWFARQQAQAGEYLNQGQLGLQGIGVSTDAAARMAGLGEIGRAADIQNAQLLETIGKETQQQQQQLLDMGYEDFLRQQAWPEQQLQLYSSVLRGVPVEPSVTQTAYQPYNPLQQALGAGLGAIGLYRGLAA